jgi:hypothetical protein
VISVDTKKKELVGDFRTTSPSLNSAAFLGIGIYLDS